MLPIAAKPDAFFQVIHAQQVIFPLLVDHTEHDHALVMAHGVESNELFFGFVPLFQLGKDRIAEFEERVVGSVSPVTDPVVIARATELGVASLPGAATPTEMLAAHRAGIKRIIMPERNKKDFEDVPEAARQAMKFVWLSTVDDAIAAAF